jgi:hypothetical protein
MITVEIDWTVPIAVIRIGAGASNATSAMTACVGGWRGAIRVSVAASKK